MRLPVIIIFQLISISYSGFAQNGYGSTSVYDRVVSLPKGKHFFVLPPNSYWSKQSWRDSVYKFPEFQVGKMELATGFVPSHRPMMNYNIFLEGIEIKPENGEAFVMKRTEDIKTVWIGDHRFFYVPAYGYMEIIMEGKVSVAERVEMRAIYELSNGTKFPLTTADVRTAVSKYTKYYWPEKDYFLFADRGHVHHATSAMLGKLNHDKKKEIKSFVRDHKTDFKKREDVLEVVRYSNE